MPKITNLLNIAADQPSRFVIKDCFETNNDSWRTYNTKSQIEFKTTI